jgi:trigger factor
LFGAEMYFRRLESKNQRRCRTQFAQQADQKLLGDVTSFNRKHKIDLPAEFLKMVANGGEKNYSGRS